MQPEKEAVVFPEESQSYRELEAESLRVAASLKKLGIGEGDTIGALMPNSLQFIHTLFGATMIGARFLPINARLAPRELAYVISDSQLKVLLTTDVVDAHVDYVSRLYQALPELEFADSTQSLSFNDAPFLKHVVLLGDRHARGIMSQDAFRELGAEVDETEIRTDASSLRTEQPCILMYTSGTTSDPKGCSLSHKSIVGLGVAVSEEGFQIKEQDRMWNPLPMFHVSALTPLIGVMHAGATFVTARHFNAGKALKQIDKEQVTLMSPAYPTLTGPLLGHADYKPESFKRVKVLMSVGSPDLLKDYQDQLPYTKVISVYGSTETGGIPVMGRAEDPLKKRIKTGRPFDGIELLVRDAETGSELPPGEVGELCVRGYNLFLGYHNDPQKTAESVDADGWFWTGDLASLDRDGYMTVQGRSKDMLKVGGENVASVEVETFLLSHPDVIVAAVVGVPDEKYVEVPVAFVELTESSTVSPQELIEYCTSGLAKYKVPREIRITKDWPMSATKIQKFKLREAFLDELKATQ